MDATVDDNFITEGTYDAPEPEKVKSDEKEEITFISSKDSSLTDEEEEESVHDLEKSNSGSFNKVHPDVLKQFGANP
jgi:hypothetical protein